LLEVVLEVELQPSQLLEEEGVLEVIAQELLQEMLEATL
jgi:hypothetical protein